MRKILYISTIASVIFFAVFYILFSFTSNNLCQILYITFMTFSYHFIMRLAVGTGLKRILLSKCDYNAKWFRQSGVEKKLYKKLKVKKWKARIPAWSPESFSTKHRSLTEIAEAMCYAELVHEVIIILSFVPVLFSIEYGVPAVFIITSVIAAAIDSVFVIVQRYNRPRIVKLINKR